MSLMDLMAQGQAESSLEDVHSSCLKSKCVVLILLIFYYFKLSFCNSLKICELEKNTCRSLL